MQVELEPEEIDSLIEALDCLKTKIAFVKGVSYAEKTAKILKVEAIELKLHQYLPPP
jgi:hypothetical protein